MHRYKTAALLIILASMMAVLASGCGGGSEKIDRLDKKIKYKHVSEPTGELFAYTQVEWMGTDDEGKRDRRSKMKQSYIVGSIETGEIVAEYKSGFDTQFTILVSEDGTRVLKQVQTESMNRLDVIMTNIKDDSVIWQRTFKSRRFPPMRSITVGWDDDAGWLVLFIDEREPEDIESQTQERDWEASQKRRMRPIECTFYVLDLNDGEIIQEKELVVIWKEIGAFMFNIRDGGGKLFFPALDDPFREERDTSGEQLQLFVVDPITWEYTMVRLPFAFTDLSTMLSDTAGENLFFQTSKRTERRSLSYLGNNIVKFNLETHKFTTLLTMTDSESYQLSGITPDGRKLCAVRLTQSEKGFHHQTVILDVTTGKVREIGPESGSNEVIFANISLSGRYIVAHTYPNDIRVFDLETGEERLLVVSPSGSEATFSPGFAGGYNGYL